MKNKMDGQNTMENKEIRKSSEEETEVSTPALTRKQCFVLSVENLDTQVEKTSEEIDIDSYLESEDEDFKDSFEGEAIDETEETMQSNDEKLEAIREIEDEIIEAPETKTDISEMEDKMMVTPALARKPFLLNEATPVAKTPEWSKSLSRELEEVIAKQNLLTSRTRRRVLVSLQDNYNTDEDGQMEKLRLRAVKEIINTEKSYLKHLEIIEEYFMNPIREGELLPQHVYVRIFGDILGIRQVNKEVLSEIEESSDHIGKVFQELAPYLKFYSTYANDFEEATKLVEEWRVKDKDFRSLLDNQESRPEVQMRLNSLLITPVQRIPRYKLLLDDIIKNTPRFHPDMKNLETARTEIDSVAWHINDQIKELEAMKRMVDIEKSIQGGIQIIKPGRKLTREGNLMKVNKNGNHAQPRYVFLFSDMLMYCKYKGSMAGDVLDLPKSGALEVCCLLPLKHMSVEEVVGKGVFTIRCQKEELVLYSSSAEDSDWVESINKAVKLHKKNKKSLKRESSMFEPMRKKEMLKLRRESLGTIMRMRKRDQDKVKMMKKELKISSPSFLMNITPRKRKERDEKKAEEKLELESELEQIIAEDEENEGMSSPSLKPRSPKTSKLSSDESSQITKILPTKSTSPDRAASLIDISKISHVSPIVPSFNSSSSSSMTMRSKKAVMKPINLARTMSMRIKRSKVPDKTVFRSPSMKNQFSFREVPNAIQEEPILNLSRSPNESLTRSFSTSTMKPRKLEKALLEDSSEVNPCDTASKTVTMSEISVAESKDEGKSKNDKSSCVIS